MGAGGSSSKRKSSKRKSSKLSYQARQKKKTKRNKTKKARPRHDSVSSGSDSDSKSLISVSSSSKEYDHFTSSEDDYKSRKGRSQSRGDAKSRKNKSRKRSSGLDSIPKKRKRSKKDVDSRLRKKSQKAKRRRNASISSASSDSRSCSTCPGGSSSSSSEEREPRRRRGLSRESRRDRRGSVKSRTETRNSRSESPGSSPYDKYSHYSHSMGPDEEKLAIEHRPVRLKSVICVVKPQPNMDNPEKDTFEEEMFYDHNDCPSSRSNDSQDGVNKIKSTYYSSVPMVKYGQVENETIEGEDLAEYAFNSGSGRLDNFGSSRTKLNTPETENEHDISRKVSDPNEDDLELLLRQKALENLRRFRGDKMKTTVDRETHNDTLVNWFSAANSIDVHEEPPKLDNFNEKHPLSNEKSNSNFKSEIDFNHHARVEMKISSGENTEKGPFIRNLNDIRQDLSDSSEKEKNSAVSDGSGKPGVPAARHKIVVTSSGMLPGTVVQEPPASSSGASAIKSPFSNPICKSSEDTAVGILHESISTDNELNESHLMSGGPSSIEQQDESKSGSQYEQKTMSVMRGGEMVQVSYKVYIPKKRPALARRQLKR